jgi:hypothetical protein
MEPPKRAVMAYIAGRLISGESAWLILDHDREDKLHLEGSFTGSEVKVYSHELNAHISGLGAEGRYTLFQHGFPGTVNLLINNEERTFSGWDHESSRHFFGNVAEATVRLFDYQDLEWHSYTLSGG